MSNSSLHSRTAEWRLLEAARIAVGVLSRRFDFQFRNAEMTRLSLQRAPSQKDPVSLRGAMPHLAPAIEEVCRGVFRTRKAAKAVPVNSAAIGDKACYLLDVFPLNRRGDSPVGVLLTDVTCYTLELLAVLTWRVTGHMVRALNDVNRHRLQAQLEMWPEGEKTMFRSLLDRSEQLSVSFRKVLNTAGHSVLSAREAQVLTMIAEARTSKEIAAALSLSEKTVRTHRDRIMRKLNVHDATALARYAVRTGLLPA